MLLYTHIRVHLVIIINTKDIGGSKVEERYEELRAMNEILKNENNKLKLENSKLKKFISSIKNLLA